MRAGRDMLTGAFSHAPVYATGAGNIGGRPAMPITENTPQLLVLKSGSTTLTLDKGAGKATMQRKLLFWALKPLEMPLSEVAEIAIDAGVDRASGIEVCNTMLVSRAGVGWAMPAADKKDAEKTSAALREFLGLEA
jgi:hypothetical protein